MAARSDTKRKTLAVVQAPVADLTENPRNPRTIKPERLEQLKRALAADPDMLLARPVIALPDGTVIAGNQRLRAAAELGWEKIPTVYADLDQRRASEWMLRDNRGFGEDDFDATAALLAELSEQGADLDLTGFAASEIDKLLRATSRNGRGDPDVAPPVPAEPRSVPGEVYALGPHRLLCGDAASGEHLAVLIGDDRPDLVCTDPPYGVDLQARDASQAVLAARRKDGKGVTNDDLTGDDLARLLRGAFSEAIGYTKKGAVWYVFAPAGINYRHFLNELANLRVFRHSLVWVKDRFVLSRADYHYRHENVVYGWTPGGRHKELEERNVDTVLEYARPSASPEHPTMKPEAMIADLIQRSSQRGEVVLDMFAGSGTTLIAAEETGRRCLAMEIDPAYCDVIRQRYADYTGQPEYAP